MIQPFLPSKTSPLLSTSCLLGDGTPLCLFLYYTTVLLNRGPQQHLAPSQAHPKGTRKADFTTGVPRRRLCSRPVDSESIDSESTVELMDCGFNFPSYGACYWVSSASPVVIRIYLNSNPHPDFINDRIALSSIVSSRNNSINDS